MAKKKDCDTCSNLKKAEDGRTEICDVGSLHFIRSGALKDEECRQWKAKIGRKNSKNK